MEQRVFYPVEDCEEGLHRGCSRSSVLELRVGECLRMVIRPVFGFHRNICQPTVNIPGIL